MKRVKEKVLLNRKKVKILKTKIHEVMYLEGAINRFAFDLSSYMMRYMGRG